MTVKASGDPTELASTFEHELSGVTRTRVLEDGVELHLRGATRIVPLVVAAAESGGVELVDLSIAEPTLETVFINLTGKDLRE